MVNYSGDAESLCSGSGFDLSANNGAAQSTASNWRGRHLYIWLGTLYCGVKVGLAQLATRLKSVYF